MTVLPPISSVGLFPTSGLNSLLPVTNPISATAAGSLSFLTGGSTVVQLSGLGQQLSAVAIFQNRLAVLQPGATDSGLGRNFGTDFGSLAAETQSFIDTFNSLQGSFNSLTGLFGSFTAGSPLRRFVTDLNDALVGEFENGDSALTRLADLGIEFEPSPIPGFVGSLSLDLAALRSAFDSDAEGSFALLGHAADALEGLAAGVTGPADNTASLLATQLQFSALQLSLNFFDDQSNGVNSTLRGFADLFALASLGDAQPATQARLLLALNEFSLVSSLLR